jgi:hypothetical protein
MNGGRKPSAWNMFVKKIYEEGHRKNSDYSFKQALTDASKRKGEMGSMKSNMGSKKSRKMMHKSRGKRSMALAGGKSRRHRRRH